MFHSDPHAGNLFLTNDRRLGILDWSLVGHLGEREQLAVVRIMQAAIELNPQAIVQVLLRLAEHRKPDQTALFDIANSRVRQIRQGHIPGLNWLIELLDDVVQTAGLRFATDLMLLRKSLHTLQGVLAEMGADDAQMDRVLLVQFLSHFATEWPLRWFTAPQSHDFATHLSNMDLARMLMNYPSTVGRFLLGKSSDLLDACSRTDKLYTEMPHPAQ